MGRADFLEKSFLEAMPYQPTVCQASFFRDVASFVTSPDYDILVASGYAGTGKTTAVATVVKVFSSLGINTVLLAPTGRSAKVLSTYAQRPAWTIHKHIYRQKTVGADGYGEFSICPNKSKDTLFIVDEVSLIGIDPDSCAAQGSSLFGSGNLLNDLVNYVRSGVDCRLLMIGDSAQLPPVGLDESPALSRPFMESCFSGVCFCSLSTVVRQARQSGILHNATLVRDVISSMGEGYAQGRELKLELDGFDDISVVMGGELIETLSDAYSRYGDDSVIVLTRSNKRAIRYNAGIRAQVQFREERLVRGERLMVVKNCYQFLDGVENLDYIANGDIVKLLSIGDFEERYGLEFATARLCLPDYGDVHIKAKVILDTLSSESPSLTYQQSNTLYQGVNEDYSFEKSKKKRYSLVREDHYYNALQLKYSNAITCHKSQGGQWECVFIDNAFWQDALSLDDLKWLYTALTRAQKRVYLVNFNKLTWPVE